MLARRCGEYLLSVNEALLCLALLLVVSNHLPASLLSPELFLFDNSLGETLDGGFALSLAVLGELSAVDWCWTCGFVLALDGGGLCRRETE